MTVFVTAGDITDSVLHERVTEAQLFKANEYLGRLAQSFGVADPMPTTMTTSLAVAVACRDCCLDLVGTDTTVQMNGNRADDIYERKYKLFAEQVRELERSLQKADFTGVGSGEAGDPGAGYMREVSIWRA